MEKMNKPKKKKEVRCSICDQTFSGLLVLQEHYELTHNIKVKIEKPKTFECDQCDKKYSNEGFLAKHKYIIHESER